MKVLLLCLLLCSCAGSKFATKQNELAQKAKTVQPTDKGKKNWIITSAVFLAMVYHFSGKE